MQIVTTIGLDIAKSVFRVQALLSKPIDFGTLRTEIKTCSERAA